MNEKHTPGPWISGLVDTMTSHGPRYRVEAGDGGKVLVAYVYEESNVQLVKAAPDLLAALVALLPTAHARDYRHPAIAQAQAAIAQAKGEA